MKRNTLGRRLAVLSLAIGMAAWIGCSAADQTFMGTMEQTEQGLVLRTEDGTSTYRVVDKPDLRALAGKNVKLTGSVMDRQAGKAISVTSYEVVN